MTASLLPPLSIGVLRVVVRVVLLAGLTIAAAARADPSVAGISSGAKFSEQDGESLYRAVCQSCHMAEGQGARGAGAYPALAHNPRLASSAYPVINVLRGRKGMPAFGAMLDDAQVAAVTNYVRTHLGNRYRDPVTAADVEALR